MAAENDIPLKITVDAAGAGQTLGEVRQSVKDLTAELNNSKEGTKRFNDALIKLGAAKATLGDLRQNIKALDPEKTAQAFVGLGQSMASGFQLATGAAALFGHSGEDVQKAMLKVQAATALASGLQGIAGMGKAIQTATLAMKAFALANPFTAILVVIIAIGAALIAFKDELFGISGAYDNNIKKAKELVVAADKELAAIEGTVNQRKLQGETEREILNLKILALDNSIATRQNDILMAAERLAAQIESDKKNKEILAGIITFLFMPLSLIVKTIDLIGSALGKQFGLYEKFTGGIASLIFDPDKTKEEGDKVSVETAAQIKKLEEQRAGLQLSIKGIDEKAGKEKAAAKQKIDEAAQKIKEAFEKDNAERSLALDIAAAAAKDAFEKDNAERSIAWDVKVLKDKEKLVEDEIALAKKVADTKKQLGRDAFNAAKSLSDTLFANALISAKGNAAKERQIKKQMFNLDKAVTASQIGINIALGISSEFKKGVFVGGPLAIINAAIQGIQLAAVLAKKFPEGEAVADSGGGVPNLGGGGGGGGGGGAGTPAAPTFQPTATGTQTTAAGEFTGFNNQQPLRAYVVETEISSNQQRVNQLQQRASF